MIYGHNGRIIQVFWFNSFLNIKYYLNIYLIVYNWTNDDVIHWLVHSVHLAIYVEYFRRNQIDGRMIPRYKFIFIYLFLFEIILD